MSLLEDIRTVVESGNVTELPSNTEILHVVGGLLKVLEEDGLKVAESLLAPAEPPAAAAADAPAAAAPAAPNPETEGRLAKIEAALEQLVHGGQQ